MKKEITIQSHDGGSFSAYVVYPATDLPAPAIVVAQEIFGVNANMRRVAEHLSQAGYIAICPDLFWRQKPGVQLDDSSDKDWPEALKFYNGFDVDLGVEDLKATLTHIRKDPNCNGRAATIGFCLGGKLAYLMATRSDADCNISYYGVGLDEKLDEAKNIRKPLLMHLAEKDKFVPLEAQQKITNAMNDMRNVEIHVYPGVDHAFARIGGAHYDKQAAQQANARTADFLAHHVTKRRS